MKLVTPALALFLFAACGAGASGNVAGTYTLDTKALVDQIVAAMPKGKDAAADEAAKKMMSDMAGKSTASVELAADGTAKMTGEMMGQKMDGKGTWKVEGDKITITSKESGKDDTKSGKIQGGTITIEMPAMDGSPKPMLLTFRKK
jgi:hypothetical protein